jgi:hypothetical protein
MIGEDSFCINTNKKEKQMKLKTFKSILSETVYSIGLNPKHEHLRKKHSEEIHNILQSSYASIGGYAGHKSGSKNERDAIMADVHNPEHKLKLTRHDGKVTSVIVYKDKYGRKLISAGTDGTSHGKTHLKNVLKDDSKMERAWGEFSGPLKAVVGKLGWKQIKSSRMGKLTGKDIKQVSDTEYSRKIGDKDFVKSGMGVAQEQCDVCGSQHPRNKLLFAEGFHVCDSCLDS